MNLRRALCCAAVAAALAGPGLAQHRNDPLNPAEVVQLRDAALEPDQRLPLLARFARARLEALENMRADPKTEDRGHKTHEMLQAFLDVFDELSDNVDMYAGRQDDMRKGLRQVIVADSEFAARLRALKDSPGVSREEYSNYEFLLSEAISTVDSALDDDRKQLTDQEEIAKRRKHSKSRKDDSR